MIPDIWGEIKKNGELAHCKKCGKKIWAFWHTKRGTRMDICGPCLSNKEALA